ncbi:uncharacterized protein DNG_01443 [Cephalotrichum gorgonifer]|uniref:F-box domain-containing protein n=1 Tax=Cephalotrichum gorgonifer TaxID=2041049 RepID=A0AAE8MRW1_9PEZI|nr:uncharacterized protein DNG_01443 [Cephalotrichum gorgonifer]
MPQTKNTVAPSELSDLPTEILTLILESLPTTDLIPILGLSTLLHETTSDVLHRRIRDTFSDPSTELILECFDDHDRISAPSLSCRYIETTRPPSPPPPSCAPGPPNLPDSPLRWQSRFRIVNRRSAETRWPRPRHTTPITPQPEETTRREEEAPTKDVTIGEGDDGVELTLRALIETGGPAALPTHLIVWEEVASVSRAWFERAAAGGGGSEEDGSVLWLGGGRNCGLRVRVRPLDGSGEGPVLVAVEERPAVSYRMEYRELLVRSMLPLVAVDRTVLERSAAEGSLAVVQVAL